jgi:tetratricopeptide (TPR) repeat protein
MLSPDRKTIASSNQEPMPVHRGDLRRSDAVLSAYAELPLDQWHGRHSFPDGEIVFPDPWRAHELAMAAVEPGNLAGDPSAVIASLNEALRLDYIGALNGGANLRNRVNACRAFGFNQPHESFELYNIGIALKHLGLWQEAGIAYHAAAERDPLFAWHLNNFAWMEATASNPRPHAGPLSVALAQEACANSGWGCWCFLGTFAAALARAGDFDRAVAWQHVTLRLAPAAEQEDLAAMLKEFEANRAHTDPRRRPAAGSRHPTPAELAQIDVCRLLNRASELIGAPLLHVH